MYTTSLPLQDLTNLENAITNQKSNCKTNVTQDLVKAIANKSKVHCHNPYNWNCLDDDTPLDLFEASSSEASCNREHLSELNERIFLTDKEAEEKLCNVATHARNVVVQFKCHQCTYIAPFDVSLGQYVVVQGDRGIDIGVVAYVCNEESTAVNTVCNSVQELLRYATQREVDYWAVELKDAEELALNYCRRQVYKNRIDMSVAEAEFQFDKKKLTFYYDAASRVDFKQLLKVLHK